MFHLSNINECVGVITKSDVQTVEKEITNLMSEDSLMHAVFLLDLGAAAARAGSAEGGAGASVGEGLSILAGRLGVAAVQDGGGGA